MAIRSRTSKIHPDRNPLYRGIPGILLPAPNCSVTTPGQERYRIRTAGSRNLPAYPFDFRNPFPLQSWNEEGTHRGAVLNWPLCGESVSDFDYYPNDHVALGLPDGPECARLDPLGGLHLLTGTWEVGYGADPMYSDYRIRRLRDGCIPIVIADTEIPEGLRVASTWFACRIPKASEVIYPLDGNNSYSWEGGDNPSGKNLFVVVRHVIHNPHAGTRRLDMRLSFRQLGALCAGAFYRHPHWLGKIEALSFAPLGDGLACLKGSVANQTILLGVLKSPDAHFAQQDRSDDKTEGPHEELYALPKTGAEKNNESFRLGQSPEWDTRMAFDAHMMLAAGRKVTVEWILPFFATPADDARILAASRSESLEEATYRYWRRRRRRGMQIHIPEKKVRDSYVQALNNMDICSVKLGRSLFPTPGPSGGHHVFYVRDGVDLIHAVALSGDAERARSMIDHYVFHCGGQESSAMILWLLGAFLDLTEDKAWAGSMFYMVRHCCAALINDWTINRKDPTGLLSETFIADGELAIGHYVSYHLYALSGLKAAVRIARLCREEGYACEWHSFLERFQNNMIFQLKRLAERTGGVITPTFEGFDAPSVEMDVPGANPPRKERRAGAYGECGGVDWHNVTLAFPTEVFDANDPLVTASLARWRHAYVEGIFHYANRNDYSMLHNYNGLNLSETWLRRGDWAEALRDLYGVLLHTSSAHASAEVIASCLRFDHGCTPHNWFSAKLVRFIRDMLVYEGSDQRLHLLGGLSPAWMKSGMTVGIENAPTAFGNLSFEARMTGNGFLLAIDWSSRPHAKGTILHLPPFIAKPQVTVGKKRVLPGKNGYALPISTRKVRVEWQEQEWPDLSFDAVVAAWLEDYASRVESFRQSREHAKAVEVHP